MFNLKCGAAERCVTPKLGLNIPQCMHFNPATGIKDDLFTHAIAIESEGKTVIMISIDTSGLGREFSDRVRNALHDEIGIDPSAVMVSAIHIHTGAPQLLDIFWGYGEDEEVNELFYKQSVEAALEAYRSRVPVTVKYGIGQEDRISFCRNYLMKDGRIRTNPGPKYIPDIVGPASEIDHSLLAMKFEDEKGRIVAEIVNFACHPDTVGGTEYCADYPGELRRLLKEQYGDHTVVFLNGFSGNINHVDRLLFKDPDFKYDKSRHYKDMGKILADDVVEIYNGKTVELLDFKVDFRSKKFIADRRQPEEWEMQWAKERFESEKPSMVEIRMAEEIVKLKEHPRLTETVEIQVLRFGEMCVVGFPGEPFSDMGLRLRERVKPATLILSELANDEPGYLATEPAYSAKVYEAKLPSAVFEIPVLEKMIDTAEELVKDIIAYVN